MYYPVPSHSHAIILKFSGPTGNGYLGHEERHTFITELEYDGNGYGWVVPPWSVKNV